MSNRCAKTLGLVCIIGIFIIFAGCSDKASKPVKTVGSEDKTTAFSNNTEKNHVKEASPDWSAITANGLDEEKFLEKLNVEDLKEIASQLQALVIEEEKEERENPDIVITEGYPRVFKKAQYKKVTDMGERAEMPLYYIIYKSDNNGMYEHICATALSELTGFRFMDDSGSYMQWSTAKEYLELFNAYIIRERGSINE